MTPLPRCACALAYHLPPAYSAPLMPITCVVLDFDGTLTDVAREAPPFTAAFPAPRR